MIGIHAANTDGLIRDGDAEFCCLCNIAHTKIETTNNEELPFTYAGLEIAQDGDGTLSANQSYNYGKFEELELPKMFSDFMSQRMNLARLANRPSRPTRLYLTTVLSDEENVRDLTTYVRATSSEGNTIRLQSASVNTLLSPQYQVAARH